MKPRVFVSSTFYDLKYIREDLANYIRAHDFEAIMFEEGDIGYTPGVELDESCYENMRNADMALLIIGGQYGSKASNQEMETSGETSNFISITRKEFDSAVKDNIPVFCFVESSVLAEYQIFKLNKRRIEEEQNSIKFSAVKNINVFKFIEAVYEIGKIPVNSFEKSDDIKEYMGKQWADMFKKYLQMLKENKTNDLLNSTIDSMDLILKQMKVMVDKIGENTIDSPDYKLIVDEQQKMELYSAVDKITKMFEFLLPMKSTNKTKNINTIIDSLENYYLTTSELNNINDDSEFNSIYECVIEPISSNIATIVMIKIPMLNDSNLRNCILNSKLKQELLNILQQDEYYNNLFFSNINLSKKKVRINKKVSNVSK